MTSTDTIYITYAYIIPAIAATLAITLIACLLGWRNTIRRNEELCAMVKANAGLAEINKALAVELKFWTCLIRRTADRRNGI